MRVSSALSLLTLSVLGFIGSTSAVVTLTNLPVLQVFENLRLTFLELNNGEVLGADLLTAGQVTDVNGDVVAIMAPRVGLFLENTLRFQLVNFIDLGDGFIFDNAFDLSDFEDALNAINNHLDLLLENVNFDAEDVDLNTDLDTFIAAKFVNGFLDQNNIVDIDTFNTAFFDTQTDELQLYSAIAAADLELPKSPSVWCLADSQCLGGRQDNPLFQGAAARICRDLDEDDEIPTCNDFVPFFNLRWLLFLIVLSYAIIVLWALYWIYPAIKKKFCAKKGRGKREGGKPEYSIEEQLVINTLAAQCASAENMLFQATDMLKQARAMKTIKTVEAKRESRIMIHTVEYFQAVSSVLVNLTHQYLGRKTWTPGDKFNLDDPATRALQLEVLNYVRDRLHLAFQSDSMSEKSLMRIGEAYAILKKVSEALVFVGFDLDEEKDSSFSNIRTPVVEFNENSFHLTGLYKSPTGTNDDNTGKKVCILVEGANPGDSQVINANAYLANSQRESKIYDNKLEMVRPGAGKALQYSPINSGVAGGDGTQYFIRTFWGPEIAAIQTKCGEWLKTDGALENFLDEECRERKDKASPVLKKSANPDKKRKKKKKKKKGYVEEGDATTVVSEYTEASGWSVDPSNTYVYNLSASVNSGLGVAGKSGLLYDKPGDRPLKKGSLFYRNFEYYMPNYAEWPKFYTFIFIIMPIIISIPMFVKLGKGSEIYDIDGNVGFKARGAGFGISYLGVPAYYFLDAAVPEADELVGLVLDGVVEDPDFEATNNAINTILDTLPDRDPFGQGEGTLFISNADAENFFLNDWNGGSGRRPDEFLGEIQSGILAQEDVDGLDGIRNQQLAQEITTAFLYALMHVAAYYWGLIPLTLVRESLELLARRFPLIRQIYPMSQWRELHMYMGLCAILYVVVGSTFFLTTALIGIGKSTPFAGLAGDPNIFNFFDLNDNVLYIRQFLLPFVPTLFLMKYASRGPPVVMRKYAPSFLTKNYWEICYLLHYVTALTAIITLVIYRPQVFYWMGATWGFVWGGNKIVRILRTRKSTIKKANLVSYTVEDKRNNAKKKTTVLRIELNVPASFPSSARGQACWLTVPAIDYVAHPFTLAKVPTETEKTIMFHISVRYLAGDDIISYARPEQKSTAKIEAPVAPPANPAELPPNWKSAVDPESGQTYYYNSLEKRTTWTKPTSTAVNKLFDGVRGITTRMSANLLNRGSARFGAVGLGNSGPIGAGTAKTFEVSGRATWTQRFANLGNRLETMDPDLRRNAVKDFPVYVSAPLGTSMDDCLQPNLPGSIIITTQNGLPAAESSVRWLLSQGKLKRPKFHFFVSVSREVNDALSVVETLRDAMCESVVAGNLNIDGLNGTYAHMADWLGVYIHLTRRKGNQIQGDRDMLMRSLGEPTAPVTPQQLDLINAYIRNRVQCGRLPFDRFLSRTQQMVRKRTGAQRLAVGYCGSAAVAYSLRSACRRLPEVKFDGEYI